MKFTINIAEKEFRHQRRARKLAFGRKWRTVDGALSTLTLPPVSEPQI